MFQTLAEMYQPLAELYETPPYLDLSGDFVWVDALH